MGRPCRDLTGQKFEKLTVLQRVEDRVTPSGNHSVQWLCQCDCGKKIKTTSQALLYGKRKSCGCGHTAEDLTGRTFGRLTVIGPKDPRKLGSAAHWICKCECGNIKEVLGCSLKKGLTRSCGCLHKERVRQRLTHDLTGQRFGRLVALYQTDNIGDKVMWHCQCDCGNECDVQAILLESGSTRSCGCYKSEQTSERFTKDMTGQRIGMLTVLKRAGSIIGADDGKYAAWLCQCDCGNTTIVKGSDLRAGKVHSCGCLISYGEYSVRQCLNDYDIKYTTQYTFHDLVNPDSGRQLRFDFAILNKMDQMVALIEYQGIQHSKESNYKKDFGKLQREVTDQLKRDYCKQHNILLFEISYKDDILISVDDIISQLQDYKLIPCQAS